MIDLYLRAERRAPDGIFAVADRRLDGQSGQKQVLRSFHGDADTAIVIAKARREADPSREHLVLETPRRSGAVLTPTLAPVAGAWTDGFGNSHFGRYGQVDASIDLGDHLKVSRAKATYPKLHDVIEASLEPDPKPVVGTVTLAWTMTHGLLPRVLAIGDGALELARAEYPDAGRIVQGRVPFGANLARLTDNFDPERAERGFGDMHTDAPTSAVPDDLQEALELLRRAGIPV